MGSDREVDLGTKRRKAGRGLATLGGALALSALGMLCAGDAAAQAFPTRPITMIYPYAGGGGADIMLRLMSEHAGKTLGQSVLVDVRPGGNGRLGPQAVVNQRGNGYTISMVANSTIVAEPLRDPANFNLQPGRDYTPILATFLGPYILAVSATLPIKDVPGMIAYSKANRGKMNYAVGQIGNSAHIAMVALNENFGTDFTMIAYKGSAPMFTAMVSGEAHAALVSAPIKPFADAGKVTLLAVTTEKRMALFPNVPTVKEAGLPFMNNWGFWVGLIGAPELPRDITTKLNRAFDDSMKVPEVAKKLVELGYEPLGGPPEEFGTLIRNELNTMGPFYKKIKMD